MGGSSMNDGVQTRFSWLIEKLYPLYFHGIRPVRSSPLFTRLLFRVRLPQKETVSWDFTTLVLRKALAKSAGGLGSVLEIGVGRGALLSLYLAKKYGARPRGVDVVPEHVQSAKRIAEHNGVPLDLKQSDLFENVDGRFDLIFFNSVYIPTDFGHKQEIERRRNYDDIRGWHGGSDGTEVISEFLRQAPEHLAPGGKVFLGVNNFYVTDDRMTDLIRSRGLVLSKRITSFWNPSSVYMLGVKGTDHGK
jgi:release factor glutamine methyltransferase